MRPEDLEALPPARLAGDGVHVVCATPGCGFRIAMRRPANDTVLEPNLLMLEGWYPMDAADPRVWGYSARAYAQASRGLAPAFRRPVRPSGRGVVGGADLGLLAARHLPAAARCPACKRLQRLDSAML